MKNLAIVLSHCDTLEKIDVLKQQIQSLKKFKIDTLLISHIPLDASLQKEVAYYIYDEDNPLLYWPERTMRWWDKNVGTDTLSVGMTCMAPDHGWTAIDQILKATNFALPLKYDYYSFINYDTRLTPELKSCLLDPSSCSRCPVIVTQRDEPPLFYRVSTLFTILEHPVLSQVSVNISKAAYLKHSAAENYWENLLLPYSCFTLPWLVSDSMGMDGPIVESERSCSRRSYCNNRFRAFFQNGNEPTQPRLTQVYFYDIKDNTSIQMECNNQTHTIKQASVIELPKKVTKLGVWDQDVYRDFLPEFDVAARHYHSIYQFNSEPELFAANIGDWLYGPPEEITTNLPSLT